MKILKMKKNKASLFLTLALLTILLMKNDFFKNIYFVITKNYETRFISAYNKNQFSGYCSKESHGYVYYIKNKFDVNEPPKIINFSEKRMKLPYWIFNKNKQIINKEKLIILNYDESKSFDFNNYLIKDNFNNRCFFITKK